MPHSAVATLAAIPWQSNTGYAIAPLERLFCDVALELAGGDRSLVHFMYRSLEGGRPDTLPDGVGVHSHNISDGSPDGLRRARAIVASARPDLVIAFDLQAVHPVYRLMREEGVSTIVSYWGAPISGLSPWWKRTLKRVALSMSRSRPDGLIFESEAMADLAVRGRGVPRRMIDVVPLGIDIARFAPKPSDYVYETFGVPRNRRVVVYSGHCTARKGIRTLVEAALELERRGRRDVFFLICGNKGDESRPFEAIYEGRDASHLLRFAGYRSDLVQIFQSAYCGVIPSSGWDSFTYSAIEMAGTGLPVVASRLQGLSEAVLDGQTGLLFTRGSPAALADAVEALLDDPALASRLGRAGRVRCEQDLSLSRQRERFLAAVHRHFPPGARVGEAAAVPRRTEPRAEVGAPR